MTDWQDRLRKVDVILLATTMSLVMFGLLVLYSIGDGSIKKQAVWVVVGLIVMTAAALFNYNTLRHYTLIIYSVNIFFLMVIAVMGKVALGAQRWIQIGAFSFQPSELSKIMVIITLGAYLAEKKGELHEWRDIMIAIAHIVPPLLLILFQPDLGTALVLIAIMGGMLVAAGIKPKHMAVLSVAAYLMVALAIRWHLLQAYQMKRLMVFINPSSDPLGSGYNLRQSMIAIGSGGIFGKGLFSGTQSRLDFLPAAVKHTDFIFAVVGEELGFIGAASVLALFFFIITRVMGIAVSARSHFGLMIAAGIGSMWIFQVLVNIGMTIGIMPVTGIPLPFMSYGGSSM
ncbi:hypothetical protein LCGC14_2502820, partial [marine sediment metagenome]